jgi:hypothetical protein
MAKKIIVAHFVTEAQAEEVLAVVGPWLRHRPPIGQFREQLDWTVGIAWAAHRVTGHYHAVSMALRESGLSAQRLKTALRATEESSASPEMVNYPALLKLDELRPVLVALDKLEHAQDCVPAAFFGRKPGKGPAARSWYFGFVCNLSETAKELGIEVTTQGDRERDPYATPFTRFVFAVEKLLPRTEQSASLTACAKQIERAIKASAHEIGVELAIKASLYDVGVEQAIEVLRSRDPVQRELLKPA